MKNEGEKEVRELPTLFALIPLFCSPSFFIYLTLCRIYNPVQLQLYQHKIGKSQNPLLVNRICNL